LSFAGVPALYFHSLFGTRGDPQAVQRTGHLRSINRQKLNRIELESEMATAGSIRAQIFGGLGGLIRARQSLEALDPSATQECLDLGPQVFGMRRTAASGRWLVCLAEVAGLPAQISLDVSSGGVDRLSGERVSLDAVNLAPHQARWIDVTAGSA
ncbi:MAG TPA: hypothetical protein VFI11_07120, partial [Anaerolineales bacterium]|nr:hypothetical protein [Anaerolineales bacterium]